MGELAILAVSGAGVTITVAVCMFVLGRRAADSERRASSAEVRAATLTERMASANASAEQWKATSADLERRLNELAGAFNEAVDHLPADGARARVLARWNAVVAVSGHATEPAGTVQSDHPAAPGPNDLLKPGD